MTNFPVTAGELVDSVWLNHGTRRYIDPRTAVVDINTTLTESSLFNGAAVGAATGWKIAANSLGTDRAIRLLVMGDYLHNNVAGDTLTVRVRWGNATIMAPAASSLGATISATRLPWKVEVILGNAGATNSQFAWAFFFLAGRALTGGVGLSDAAGTPGLTTIPATNPTLDTTADQYLDVSAQWSVSSVNNSVRTRLALCEVLG